MPTRPMNTDRLMRLLAAGDLAVWPDLTRDLERKEDAQGVAEALLHLRNARRLDNSAAACSTTTFRPVMDCAPNALLDGVLAP